MNHYLHQGVEAWIVDLNDGAGVRPYAETLLAHQERERANRFRHENERERFILTHAILRELLSQYLHVSPATLDFTLGANGKPSLTHFPWLRFNLSHARDLAAFAFTSNCDLGIDIEAVRDVPQAAAIVSHFFCRGEQADLTRLEEHEFAQAFYRTWVSKEAYLKAVGAGLSMPLNSFQVSVAANSTPRLLVTRNGDAHSWTLQSLPLESGYVGAIAYRDLSRTTCIQPRTTAANILTPALTPRS